MAVKEKESVVTPGYDEAADTICYNLAGIQIDKRRLVEDYERVASGNWTEQNRYAAEASNWKGISLYSISGASDDLRCADRPIVKQTPSGEACPYICGELLPQFGAKLLRVAFYRLSAGTVVGLHKDYGQNRTTGMVRIHIPVVTSDEVVMHVEQNRYHMAVGEAWYFDASCWHSVQNKGGDDRIHLIADFYPSSQLDAHLKPIQLKDRIRFFRASIENYAQMVTTFLKFIRSKEGRKRILDRVGVKLGRG